MNLVLDLDETLISVTLDTIKDYDFRFTIQGTKFYGKKRPGLELFLSYVFKHFASVSVWTAATMEYAKKVANNIFTKEQMEKIVFFKTRRDLSYDGFYPEGSRHSKKIYKPLEKIFNDPKAIKHNITKANTVMVDDRQDFMRYNPGNGIIIPPFKRQLRDKYLPKLLIVLDGILFHQLDFTKMDKSLVLKDIVD